MLFPSLFITLLRSLTLKKYILIEMKKVGMLHRHVLLFFLRQTGSFKEMVGRLVKIMFNAKNKKYKYKTLLFIWLHKMQFHGLLSCWKRKC